MYYINSVNYRTFVWVIMNRRYCNIPELFGRSKHIHISLLTADFALRIPKGGRLPPKGRYF